MERGGGRGPEETRRGVSCIVRRIINSVIVFEFICGCLFISHIVFIIIHTCVFFHISHNVFIRILAKFLLPIRVEIDIPTLVHIK